MNRKILIALMLFSPAFMINANNAEKFISADEMTREYIKDEEDIHRYRRLRSVRDDNAKVGDLDAPKVLRIIRTANTTEYLHEDGLSGYFHGRGINFLGIANSLMYPENTAPDGSVKHNYHLFLDTAYINRGTGNIKPQYMIAVGVNEVKSREISGKDHSGTSVTKTIKSYVEGRYLINATDSARELGSTGSQSYLSRNEAYLFNRQDCLAFVDAIRVYEDDRLYIVSELVNNGVTREQYIITTESGEEFIDGDALDAMTKTIDGVPGKLVGTERVPDNNMMYGAYYQFDTWDNYHNDVCFSLRFVDPEYARNADKSGIDIHDNYMKRFYIESEAQDRTLHENAKFSMEHGGWIGLINEDVPVLVRGKLHEDAFPEAFTVAEPPITDWQDGQATSNDNIATEEEVIAGEGSVTIFNAAGKHVVISNLLGQTILSKTLASNNESVKVPKGLVVVTIDGNKSFKLAVK